jgi:hypothetical protein
LPSLIVVLLLLAGATIVGVFLGLRAGLGAYALLTLVATGAVALAFINEYRKLPTGGSTPVGAPSDEEPFEDPVEEADRLDRQAVSEPEGSSEIPTMPTDDSTEPASTEPRN